MGIIKNTIPILEYDNNVKAIIMPDHENLEVQFPKKAVFAFLGDCIDKYAKENQCKVIAEFISITKTYPVYLVNYQGEDICLCQAPLGSAAATQILDWLISYGVKKVISAGSCGALVDLPENVFLVPTKALRDEGASYHYLPPSRFVELKQDVLQVIESTLVEKGLPYIECITWSTDGFYRETEDMVRYRREEGCSVVEMECAALTACAKFRQIDFGQILFTADSLANISDYDERDWGRSSLEKALFLCMDIVRNL